MKPYECSKCGSFECYQTLGTRRYKQRVRSQIIRKCKSCSSSAGKLSFAKWYLQKSNRDAATERAKAAYFPLRESVIKAYGGKCKCCGERQHPFLAIDHIGGGGHEHRKTTGGSLGLYRKLFRAGCPAELDGFRFRLLCANCNAATRRNKQCPHETMTAASIRSGFIGRNARYFLNNG